MKLALLALLGCVEPEQQAPPARERAAAGDACGPWIGGDSFELELVVGGRTRRAVVQVPPGSEGPRDLVIALHGMGASAAAMRQASHFGKLGQEEGFIAAFPDSATEDGSWNAGPCCGEAQAERIDDLAFLEALTAELRARTCADHVLVAGFSNGAMLAQHWACTSDAVEALVVASGQLLDPTCAGGPLPIRHYHGTADTFVPIDGREMAPPLEEAFEGWRARNRCSNAPPVQVDHGPDTCRSWSCAAPTELCLIDGWGHKWPGGKRKDEARMDATVEAWSFFERNVTQRPRRDR